MGSKDTEESRRMGQGRYWTVWQSQKHRVAVKDCLELVCLSDYVYLIGRRHEAVVIAWTESQRLSLVHYVFPRPAACSDVVVQDHAFQVARRC